MKVAIGETLSFSHNLLRKIANVSPWEWLKNQLLEKEPTDVWVKAVRKNLSSVLLTDNDEIISYWCFGNKGKLIENIIESIWFELEKTFVWIYLFTVKKYQNKGYARKLKEIQLKYIKINYPTIKYFVWTTFSKKLFDLYKKYWAKQINEVDRKNKILIEEWMNKDYFYYYEI